MKRDTSRCTCVRHRMDVATLLFVPPNVSGTIRVARGTRRSSALGAAAPGGVAGNTWLLERWS